MKKNSKEMIEKYIIQKQLSYSTNTVDSMNSFVGRVTIEADKWNKWSEQNVISFKSCGRQGIGNGEYKLAYEFGLQNQIGGQNKTHDLNHPEIGKISVKDMTNGGCILGADCIQCMHTIFRKVLYPLVQWSEKHRFTCIFAREIYAELLKKYGKATWNILDGIERTELSKPNLYQLNRVIENIKNHFYQHGNSSEYIQDMCAFLGKESLIDKLNHCVRKEAIMMNLIIVDKHKGWMLVKNVNNLYCPRITRKSPRIYYKAKKY